MTPANAREKPAAIEARGLSKFFADGKIVALRDVDLTVMPGESVALTGRSGSGKTTLLFALCGLIELDRGSVRIAGDLVVSATKWTRLRAERIGIVFQDAWLLPTLTALENIELPMIGMGDPPRARRRRAMELLTLVGVADVADRMPGQLSGGERQRVAVARALANRPSILLADEPTGELDSANADHLISLLLRLCGEEGTTLVIVTHDRVVAGRCGREFELTDGSVSAPPPFHGREGTA